MNRINTTVSASVEKGINGPVMAFCGQCGYLLAPNATKCPRCSASIETSGNVDEMPSDAPTIHVQQGSMPPEDRNHTWQSISQQEAAQTAGNNDHRENIDTTAD